MEPIRSRAMVADYGRVMRFEDDGQGEFAASETEGKERDGEGEK